MRDTRTRRRPLRIVLAATAAALAFALVGTGVAFAAGDGIEGYVTDADLTGKATTAPAQNETLPNAGQLDYQRNSLAAFCHFGPNTFANIEWGESYGDGMAEAYDYMNELSSFDADGYVKMLKDAGFQRLIFTVKHHDGFCLYQSNLTDYDMERVTSYKNGKGDLLEDLSTACTKYDMDMGLYLSPWDIHDPSYGYYSEGEDDEIGTTGSSMDPDINYNYYYNGQLEEILSSDKYGNEGKFVEVWMDGAKGGDGDPNSPDAQVYTYDMWADTIHKYEGKDCIIFQCREFTGVRWIGNEEGTSVSSNTDELWAPVKVNASSKDGYEFNQTGGVQVGYADGDLWTVPEVDAKITSGWFWGTGGKSTPKSLQELSTMYFNSIGHGATFLLNVPPNTSGTVDDAIKARVEEFAMSINNSFDDNLAEGATAYATSAYASDPAYGPGKVLDGDQDSFWCANANDDQSLVIELGGKQTFDIVSIEEAIQNGQRINSFTVSYRDSDGNWQEFGSGATIGSKRLVRSTPVISDAIKIEVETYDQSDSVQQLAQISEVGVYKASPAFEIPTPIPVGFEGFDNVDMTSTGTWKSEKFTQCYEGTTQWSSTAGSTLTFAFTGTQFCIIGTADPGHGIMGVQIDGGDVIQVKTNEVSARDVSALLYSSSALENREHTVVISVVSGAVGIDAAAYLPGGTTMVQFDTATATMNEDSTLTLTLTRVGDLDEELTVYVSPEPGTATQGHFDTESQTITFEAGQSTATATVSSKRVVGGAQSGGSADGDRSFFATLSLSSDDAILGPNDVVTITINDLDVDLQETLDASGNLDVSNCSAESAATYLDALEAAYNALKNAEISGTELEARIEALETAAAGLASTTQYTEDTPFVFPTSSRAAVMEFEYGTITNDSSNDGGWPVAEHQEGNGEISIDAVKPGDKISVPAFVAAAGEYNVTLSYSSGSASNTLAWSDENEIFEPGQQAVDDIDDGGKNLYEVSFKMSASETGTTVLEFTAPTGKSCPRLNKLTITYAGDATTYDVTTEVTGNGSVDPTEATVEAGGAQSFSATPAEGYKVGTVAANGEDVKVEGNRFTLVNVSENTEVAVTFIEDPDYTFTVTPEVGEGGSVTPGTAEVTRGDAQKFTVTPNPGYDVDEVLVNGAAVTVTDGTFTVTNLQPDTTITVSFKAVDKTELSTTIGECAAMSQDDYTADSWSAFAAALQFAREVFNDAASTQAEVDDALAALKSAKAALKPAESTTDPGTNPDDEKPGDTTDPDDQKPGDVTEPDDQKPGDTTKPSGSTTGGSTTGGSGSGSLAQTGDPTSVVATLAAALAGAGALVASRKRR